MKKKLTSFFIITVAMFSVTALGQSITEDDAKAAAHSIYHKGATLAETVAKTRPFYEKWREKQIEELAKNVSLGKWYVSHAYHSKYAEKYDPLTVKFNPDAIAQNENFWKTPNIIDGQPFDLQKLNPLYLADTETFMYRTIEAQENCKIAITLSGLYAMQIYLNGKLVAKIDKDDNDDPVIKADPNVYWLFEGMGYNGKTEIIALDIKKGINELLIKTQIKPTKSEKSIMFSPFADATIFLAQKAQSDFPFETKSIQLWKQSKPLQTVPALFSSKDNSEFTKELLINLVETSMFSAYEIENRINALEGKIDENSFIERIKIFEEGIKLRRAERELGYDIKNIRVAMEDATKSYPEQYDKKLFEELKKWEKEWNTLKSGVIERNADALSRAKEFNAFAKRALLANPLLKEYPNWVFVKRDSNTKRSGLPANWQGNTSLTNAFKRVKGDNFERVIKPHTYKDQLWSFNLTNPDSTTKLVFKPSKDTAISDIDISYDANRIMFSSIDDNNQWNIDEYDVKTGKVKELSPRIFPDIDNYDGCYLPDGKIIYCSTATFVGVPCVEGVDYVPNLFVMAPNAGTPEQVDKTIRQLTYEQDADWMPIVLENGRILYTRWEYTDNSHYFARILMHMNPDGTAQSSFYGTTSFWPNSLFYCRPIPSDPNKFVGIVSGHHGISRTGELHIFDVSKGNVEDKGRLHKYPSYGRNYEAKMLDQLVNGKWPQLIHPYPLSEKYIVCAGRESLDDTFSEYGGKFRLYLVDAFDNMVPLVDFADNCSAMEPLPLQARKKPQEIMDKTNPELDYGYIFLNDIYQGDGLKDVPRGTVKGLRVIEYFYGYRNTGNHHVIAEEGSWDIKRIHGTVAVEEDGSAFFKAPANRPIAIQPLDKDGNALALMRSWLTVMPGETQSCVGCHESQGMTPTSKPTLAGRKKPQEIKKFIGDVRGYSYKRDVQPVLDKYCSGCHDGSKPNRPNLKRGPEVFSNVRRANGFDQSYLDLMRYVRRSGPESNQHMLSPLEFHSSTSELMQMLLKGHNGVELDKQSMDILRTWIDLNVPYHGVWTEVYKKIPWDDHKRRAWALAKYANRHDDQNAINYDGGEQKFVQPKSKKTHATQKAPKVEGFPFDANEAEKKRNALNLPKEIIVDLEKDVQMRFTLIPAGKFAMGTNSKFYDEGPMCEESIEKPFYMAQFETTNRQFNVFDPTHDSGQLDRHWKDHVNPGYPANRPNQPVIRVNWNDAQKFCEWLSKKLGLKVSLPTEIQWEWAARAGSASDFWFGKVGDNYGAFDNLADWNIRKFAVDGIDPQPIVNPSPYIAFIPNDTDIDDGQLTVSEVGLYKPNPFGLYDINGNVAEWTANDYTETLKGKQITERKTVRGGSWRDRAKWSRLTVRRNYAPWQKIYNVGFRVVIDDAQKAAKLFKEAKPLPEPPSRNTIPREDTIKK